MGKAVRAGARAIDRWTVAVVRLLRGSPAWRLGVVVYLLCLHLLAYSLLSRLQHAALQVGELQRSLHRMQEHHEE